ncbi:MATE family efflux transporter [Kordiimonas sp. SCSIO 12603]|uniref:MATE family efflux transporter n=1 Tax=Kordiimonas sp. SCSIO 12603 TaxID=2829596 RepID=UPI0021056DEA|nr:MATE family efflux transporter [Kordiimonas sp. SCSIO 12603]UTW59136.1 MATE family efflux transporter [Kordiimonas sp. SCSIO 12603]
MITETSPYKANADKRIWAIAGPAILANSSAPLVGLIDTWVIGHMPDAVHLAAVGVGASVFSLLFWAFGFLRMSTTGLIAQAHGQKDTDQIARIFIRSSMLGVVIALILLVFQAFIFSLSITALVPPENTQPYFAQYFNIRIWSTPAVLFVYTLNGYLIGTAQAKAALYLQLVLNILNAVLNLIFVLGLGMGVAGIALGSVIAEWSAVFVGLYFVSRRLGFAPLKIAIASGQTWVWGKVKKLAATNGFIFLRTLLLMTALALITKNAAKLGDTALAASQVLNVFLLLIALGLDGFAYAAEALVGAAYGKENKREFRFWVIRTSLWAFAAAVVYSLFFLIFGETIISTLTNIQDVRLEAFSAIFIMGLTPVMAVWSYQFDGIYIGATSGKGMFITMIFAFLAYLLALEYFGTTFGLQGLWTAVLIFMTARGIAQAIYYPKLEKTLK